MAKIPLTAKIKHKAAQLESQMQNDENSFLFANTRRLFTEVSAVTKLKSLKNRYTQLKPDIQKCEHLQSSKKPKRINFTKHAIAKCLQEKYRQNSTHKKIALTNSVTDYFYN